MTTLLILLPGNPAQAPRALQLDAAGSVLARFDLAPGLQRPAGVQRCVLAIPGDDTRAMWLDLPARSQAQAQAAADILVRNEAADSGQDLLVAMPVFVGGSSSPRLVVAVARRVLRRWLDRIAALGFVPDAVIPDYMLLPVPEPSSIQVVVTDGQWLVRGHQLAFSAEPDLAKMVLGDRAVSLTQDPQAVERQLALGACSTLPIDLLQQDFATRQSPVRGWPARNRTALLVAALALSPFVLSAVQAGRHELAARDLRSRALVVARTVLPQLGPDANALFATRQYLEQLQTTDAFAHGAGALFLALQRVEGAQLEAIEFTASAGLQATVSHRAPADLEILRAQVRQSGIELRELNSHPATQGLRSDILLEQAK